MADQEATLYYFSSQTFDFEKACDYFTSSSLSLKQPGTQSIFCTNKLNSFTESNQEKLKDLVFSQVEFSVKLWLNPEIYIFWSFIQNDDYFFQNFGLYYLDDVQMKKMSEVIIEYALKEVFDVDEQIIGFIIDQYGQTDDYDFGSFLSGQEETINCYCLPDIMYLPQDKLGKVILDKESQVIKLNQNFTCIANNKDLADYLQTLL